jgi:hypothetical protein
MATAPRPPAGADGPGPPAQRRHADPPGGRGSGSASPPSGATCAQRSTCSPHAADLAETVCRAAKAACAIIDGMLIPLTGSPSSGRIGMVETGEELSPPRGQGAAEPGGHRSGRDTGGEQGRMLPGAAQERRLINPDGAHRVQPCRITMTGAPRCLTIRMIVAQPTPSARPTASTDRRPTS